MDFFTTCVGNPTLICSRGPPDFCGSASRALVLVLLLQYASFSSFVSLERFPQVLTYCRTNFHIVQDQMCVSFSAPICWRRVPSPGVQDLSPSHLLSVNLPPELHPETTLWSGGDWWWAEEQRLVLWKALRGAMETLHTQSSERPDIESRASEQWTAGYASDAKQGFRKCTQRARWVAIRNK